MMPVKSSFNVPETLNGVLKNLFAGQQDWFCFHHQGINKSIVELRRCGNLQSIFKE